MYCFETNVVTNTADEADWNVQCPCSGATVWHMILCFADSLGGKRYPYQERMESLLRKVSPKLDMKLVMRNGDTLLHCSVYAGVEVVDLLLERCNPNAVNVLGQTPLMSFLSAHLIRTSSFAGHKIDFTLLNASSDLLSPLVSSRFPLFFFSSFFDDSISLRADGIWDFLFQAPPPTRASACMLYLVHSAWTTLLDLLCLFFLGFPVSFIIARCCVTANLSSAHLRCQVN